MGEVRILQDHSLLKESICKMDCLFLPAEIMSGSEGSSFTSRCRFGPYSLKSVKEWEKHEKIDSRYDLCSAWL